jgi:hypothetical protein
VRVRLHDHLPEEKHHSFLIFPYVCPEPVLIPLKCSFAVYKWLKKTVLNHLSSLSNAFRPAGMSSSPRDILRNTPLLF